MHSGGKNDDVICNPKAEWGGEQDSLLLEKDFSKASFTIMNISYSPSGAVNTIFLRYTCFLSEFEIRAGHGGTCL